MKLRRYTAAQFRTPMKRGLNRPFLVLGEAHYGTGRSPLVFKSRTGYADRPDAMLKELFALLLARELGLKAPEPVLVELPAGFDWGAGITKEDLFYNPRITLRHIPLEAYDYVVNGKPALEWVMERQSVTTDKASGIVNDANLWATETMQNPAFPPGTLPPRRQSERGDDEDCGELAGVGD